MAIEDNEFGRMISIFYRRFQTYINNEMKDYDITSSEYTHLLNLEIGQNVNQSYFTTTLGLDKGVSSRVLASLEKKGYIIKKLNKYDKRNHTIKLTKKGERIKPVLVEKLKKWENLSYNNISSDDYDKLAAITKQIYFNITNEEYDI